MNVLKTALAATLTAALGWATPAFAHCDTLDGPVVSSAQKALDSGHVEYALIWVQEAEERTIREAFAKARAARTAKNPSPGKADQAFYATLVRIHRKGEGASFTGLKPAGTIEPPVAAADNALSTGRFADVETPIVERTREALKASFDDVLRHKEFDPSDVEAGRSYVGAYVRYVHLAEAMYDAAAPAKHDHGERDPAKAHAPGAPASKAAHAH